MANIKFEVNEIELNYKYNFGNYFKKLIAITRFMSNIFIWTGYGDDDYCNGSLLDLLKHKLIPKGITSVQCYLTSDHFNVASRKIEDIKYTYTLEKKSIKNYKISGPRNLNIALGKGAYKYEDVKRQSRFL